jgi:hypothetical protein
MGQSNQIFVAIARGARTGKPGQTQVSALELHLKRGELPSVCIRQGMYLPSTPRVLGLELLQDVWICQVSQAFALEQALCPAKLSLGDKGKCSVNGGTVFPSIG